MNCPNEMSGSHPLASWLNKLLKFAKSLLLISGPGYKVTRTTNGTVIQLDPAACQPKHPFKVYPGSTWLKWKVAAGYVIYTPSGALTESTNTDTEITVTTGIADGWIYADASTPTVAYSTTRPTWSATIIPIAQIDTLTLQADTVAIVTQFCTTNIFSPCE